MDFFIVLSGGIESSPINKVWFIEAATGVQPAAAWTWNSICQFNGAAGSGSGTYSNCAKAQVAQYFDPRKSFANDQLPPYFQRFVKCFVEVTKEY